MNPIFAQADSHTRRKLLALRQEAQSDKVPRVALRLQALLLSADGHTPPQIADLLHVHRTRVHAWVCRWNEHGQEGIKEGHRSGRPCQLTPTQLEQLHDIVESGPVAYGFNSGVWTSPVLAGVIQVEFDVDDVDRQDFLKILAEACQKTGWQVHTYCLMRNHFHLVVETPNANLVAGMA